MIRRALLVVMLVSAGLAVAGTGPAYGCSCRAGVPIEETLAGSDAAFVGVFTGRDDPRGADPIVSSGRRVVNHFDVERIVKGDIGPTVDVEAAAGGASCGLELPAGARTGLFLRRDAGRWTSSLCSQVAVHELLAVAPGGGVVPAPAGGDGVAAPAVASGGGDGDEGPDWGFILFAGLLMLAVPAAFVVGGVHRRRP